MARTTGTKNKPKTHPLKATIEMLKSWNLTNKGKTSKRCLEAVRACLATQNLKIPRSGIDYNGNTALDCFKALSESPEKWGWQKVGHDEQGNLPKYTLVFFKKCGYLPWRNIWAGHIAILNWDEQKHYSNDHYLLNKFWSKLLVGAFVPITRKEP